MVGEGLFSDGDVGTGQGNGGLAERGFEPQARQAVIGAGVGHDLGGGRVEWLDGVKNRREGGRGVFD